MASNHRVFVLRMTPDDAGAPPGDSTTVSPPASYLPGDRWRVDWTFTAPPVTARFAAVLAELPLTSDSGHPGLPGETSGPVVPTSGTSAARPSADDTTSQTLRDRLLRAGPEPYVVARDEVTLAQP